MNLDELSNQLAKVSHFSQLPISEVRAIISTGRIQTYSQDEILFLENEPGMGLFVLLSGQVQLCKLSPEGQVAILSVFEPVIMFNEVPALDHGPNPATAIALSDIIVWRMDSRNLDALLVKHPQIASGLLRLMASRNRHLVSHFEDLSFRSVLARTAKILLELSNHGAHPVDRRKNPNHQMAGRIATIPEAFSRSLGIFKVNADILCTHKSIQVLRPDHLQELARIAPVKPNDPR